jgi:hypothetical protein
MGAVATLGAAACAFLVAVAAGQGVGPASLWAGVISALAGIGSRVVATWRQMGRRTAPAHGVVITSPAAGQRVPHAVTARGSADHIHHNITLWLIVRAGRSYYPQGKIHLPVSGTSEWIEPVYFGSANGSLNHEFALDVVAADPEANSQFEMYVRRRGAAGKVRALSDSDGTYPKVPTYASVNVVRGQCRLA